MSQAAQHADGLILDAQELRIVENIAEGPLGTVEKHELRRPGGTRSVAVKHLKFNLPAENSEAFMAQAEQLTTLEHVGLARMEGLVVADAADEDAAPALVSELCMGGSLRDLLDYQQRHPMERIYDYIDVLQWLLEVARGLRYLHSRSLTHRRLKLENIVLTSAHKLRHVKVTDCGLQELLDCMHQGQTAPAPSSAAEFAYLPPEVLRQRPAGQAADVFSFGILAYELLTRSALLSGAAVSPTEREGLWAFSGLVADGWRPAIPAHWHPELVRTVKCCWASKPRHRPTFEQLVPKLRSLRDAVAVMDIVEKQERDLGRPWGAAVPSSQDVRPAAVRMSSPVDIQVLLATQGDLAASQAVANEQEAHHQELADEFLLVSGSGNTSSTGSERAGRSTQQQVLSGDTTQEYIMWGASPKGSEAVRSLTGTEPSGSHTCSFRTETSDASSSTGCPAAQYRQRSFILPEVRPLLNLSSRYAFGSNDGPEDDLLMSVQTHGKASVQGVKLIDSAPRASKYEPLGKKPAGWAPETAEWRPVAPVKQRKQSRNWLCSFFALPKAVESARFHP
eukprot:jgi/Astpho2/3879/Aster-x1182